MNKNATIADLEDELLKNGKAQVAGFGAFKVNVQPARVARNPQTGEAVNVPEKRVVKFTPFSGLKDAVNA